MNDLGLELENVTVRYGGIRAATDVTLSAPLGRTTGLIGPNGAGKTTTFAACSGLVRPTHGTVSLAGTDITGLSPQLRAQHGLGRTFQRMELFGPLSVEDNVGMGLEAGLAKSNPWHHLRCPRSETDRIRAAVDDALARCDLTRIRQEIVGNLSTGQQRLVELARVIAGGFRMLLLDEPSSGLDKTETTRFGEILRTLVVELGRGILLVEHDMSLVLRICEYIYVLDFGEMIYEGMPTDVARSAKVKAAYLGSADLQTEL